VVTVGSDTFVSLYNDQHDSSITNTHQFVCVVSLNYNFCYVMVEFWRLGHCQMPCMQICAEDRLEPNIDRFPQSLW
jgi:hypothetical protein